MTTAELLLGQVLAITGFSLVFLLTILWTALRFTMHGEEKYLTNVFRRHKA